MKAAPAFWAKGFVLCNIIGQVSGSPLPIHVKYCPCCNYLIIWHSFITHYVHLVCCPKVCSVTKLGHWVRYLGRRRHFPVRHYALFFSKFERTWWYDILFFSWIFNKFIQYFVILIKSTLLWQERHQKISWVTAIWQNQPKRYLFKYVTSIYVKKDMIQISRIWLWF